MWDRFVNTIDEAVERLVYLRVKTREGVEFG